jgi:hypothetical protein
MSDSSKSFSSASSGHGGASVVVCRLWCLISSGSTTSALNNNQKRGEVGGSGDRSVVTLYCLGMTSAHLPFFSPLSIFLIASKINALARSTTPWECG